MTKELRQIKAGFEQALIKCKLDLKAEQVREFTAKKRIEDITAQIAEIMKNLQAVDNIKERE